MKKMLSAMITVFVLLLTVGLWFNLRRGLYFWDEFFVLSGENTYTSSSGSIRFLPPDSFDVRFGDHALTATLADLGDDRVSIHFSDGVTLTSDSRSLFSIAVANGGEVFFGGKAQYIISDLSALPLRFEKAAEPIRTPFYDEKGTQIGESITLLSLSGEFIDSREIYDSAPEWNMPQKREIILRDGIQLDSDVLEQALFRNEAGEYLMNPDALTMLPFDSGMISRRLFFSPMLRVLEGETEQRGNLFCVLFFAFFYWFGALPVLFPEQAAFFGSRWKYNSEPELSEAGRFMTQAGGAVTMILSVVFLFTAFGVR